MVSLYFKFLQLHILCKRNSHHYEDNPRSQHIAWMNIFVINFFHTHLKKATLWWYFRVIDKCRAEQSYIMKRYDLFNEGHDNIAFAFDYIITYWISFLWNELYSVYFIEICLAFISFFEFIYDKKDFSW